MTTCRLESNAGGTLLLVGFLLPNESKKYFITKEIEDIKNITFIESVNYGYKAKISTVK